MLVTEKEDRSFDSCNWDEIWHIDKDSVLPPSSQKCLDKKFRYKIQTLMDGLSCHGNIVADIK